MEKGIRTPIALVLGMPCAKFELLKIHIERAITKKGMSMADAFARLFTRVRPVRVRVRGYV